MLTSLNNSHMIIQHGAGIAMPDRHADTSVSSYVYVILVSLAVLFYGNIFWVFRKAIRYKSTMARLALCTGWFMVVFGANYRIAGPLFDQANRTAELYATDHSFKRDAAFKSVRPDSLPDMDVVNFMIGSWRHLQPVILFAFLMILGISVAYFFLKEWAKSDLIQTRLQADQLSTEIKFLKSQINPHFLFNTLNNLFSIAQAKGNDELADGISKLSGMMRYMIYDSNAASVPLNTEITCLEECITLNKLRYADEEVTVRFDYPSESSGVNIAPMLFIPFVENAFKHGVVIGQTTTIAIGIILSGQNLIFTCANTNYSAVKKMEFEKSGVGLENVKRRLDLLYPGKHRLRITETDGDYTVNLEIDFV